MAFGKEDFVIDPKPLRVRATAAAKDSVGPKVLKDHDRRFTIRLPIPDRLAMSTRPVALAVWRGQMSVTKEFGSQAPICDHGWIRAFIEEAAQLSVGDITHTGRWR